VHARSGSTMAAKAVDRRQGGWHRPIIGTGARGRVLYSVLSEIFAFGGTGLGQGLAADDSGLGERQLPASERGSLGTGVGALGLAAAQRLRRDAEQTSHGRRAAKMACRAVVVVAVMAVKCDPGN